MISQWRQIGKSDDYTFFFKYRGMTRRKKKKEKGRKERQKRGEERGREEKG